LSSVTVAEHNSKRFSPCLFENTENSRQSSLKLTNEELNSNMNFIYIKILHPLFIEPLEAKLNEYGRHHALYLVNVSIDCIYAKLFTYCFNHFNATPSRSASSLRIFHNIVLDSMLLSAHPILANLENESNQINQLKQLCQEIKNYPEKPKVIPSLKTNDSNSVKVLKSNVIPRYTSNPRLAVNLINQNPDVNYIQVRNDHVERTKYRFATAVSTLISDTLTGTDAKRSNLEIIDYKQLYKLEKCCCIGCPDIPQTYLAPRTG
jgi:hypothetical protein